jgi:hypothetical protein
LFICGAALHKIRSTAVQLHKQRLFLWRCVVAQHNEEGNVALQHNGAKEGNGNNAAVTFFFFFFVLQEKKKKKKVMAALLPSPSSSSYCGATLVWSYAVAQLHEEGDSCRRLLLPSVELQHNTTPRRRRQQLHKQHLLLWSCTAA